MVSGRQGKAKSCLSGFPRHMGGCGPGHPRPQTGPARNTRHYSDPHLSATPGGRQKRTSRINYRGPDPFGARQFMVCKATYSPLFGKRRAISLSGRTTPKSLKLDLLRLHVAARCGSSQNSVRSPRYPYFPHFSNHLTAQSLYSPIPECENPSGASAIRRPLHFFERNSYGIRTTTPGQSSQRQQRRTQDRSRQTAQPRKQPQAWTYFLHARSPPRGTPARVRSNPPRLPRVLVRRRTQPKKRSSYAWRTRTGAASAPVVSRLASSTSPLHRAKPRAEDRRGLPRTSKSA